MKAKQKLARAAAQAIPSAPSIVPRPPIKLDLGCGTNKKQEGFIGIDILAMPGVDAVADLSAKTWVFDRNPFGDAATKDGDGYVLNDNSVDEAFSSHFVEHLDHNRRSPERVRFVNELCRVLVPGGKAYIIVPYWCSSRAYGDFTHSDKPVSEFWLYYLSRDWRLGNPAKNVPVNAPHNDAKWNPNGYTCDFEFTCNYGLHQSLLSRNPETQQHATTFFKEAVQDLHITLIKPLPPAPAL